MEDIKRITIEDENYPQILKQIANPPKILYIKGELKGKENCLAIVGTRQCSLYGKQISSEFAEALSDMDITIVSGLAPGIDTFVHKTVVEKRKRTIAVLGTGIDEKSIYPRENIQLSKKIVESGGCLVSEYPPGTRGTNFTFPQRNRIISGLSLGVLIIEAKEKSGALITANYAFSQKRKVFAVPGPIHSLNSSGTHALIKKRKETKLVDNINDILQELNLIAPRFEYKNEINGENIEENLILDILKEEYLYIDKIIEKTKLPVATVAGTLAVLEIKGKVRNLGKNIYTIIR